MAIYRNVQLSFWTDNKVEDDFTPEDKYFYLYLLTNPQTNICGCYEVSYNQMTNQTGYNKDTVNRLINRFEKVHKVIRYCNETKEILILNWYKYNWSKSKDTMKGVLRVAEYIKCEEFRKYVFNIASCIENNTPIRGSIDTVQASVSDSVSVSDTDSDTVSITDTVHSKKKKVYFDDEKIQITFEDFVEMRKKIKKPMTERAKELAAKKLNSLAKKQFSDDIDSELAIAILEQSIMNCWQGLFPLKEEKNRNNGCIADTWRDL